MSIVTYIPVVLSGFPTKLLYAYVNSPVHSTCPIHRIPFDFMTLIIFRKNSKIMKLMIVQLPPVS